MFIITEDRIDTEQVGTNTMQVNDEEGLVAAVAYAQTHGTKFKLLDDDGEWYYTGYVMLDSGQSEDEWETELVEVSNWGTWYAGTTMLFLEEEYTGVHPQLWENSQHLTIGQLGWHYTI